MLCIEIEIVFSAQGSPQLAHNGENVDKYEFCRSCAKSYKLNMAATKLIQHHEFGISTPQLRNFTIHHICHVCGQGASTGK
jgi:hypothetical protein